MGLQKRRADDIDIINYQEKKIDWVAGLRKGREKEFGGTRAHACEGEISKVPFPSPRATENPFPFPFRMKPCRPKKRLQTFGIIKCAPHC